MSLARSEGSPQRFYSMSAQIREERKAYYEILEATQKGDLDITAWLEWFLGCLEAPSIGAETILAAVMQKARFWEAHAGESFNDRQRLVINRLLNGFEGKLTSSKWAKLAKCSQDTACATSTTCSSVPSSRRMLPAGGAPATRSSTACLSGPHHGHDRPDDTANWSHTRLPALKSGRPRFGLLAERAGDSRLPWGIDVC